MDHLRYRCGARCKSDSEEKEIKPLWIALALTISCNSTIWSDVHPFIGLGVGRQNGNGVIFPGFAGSVSAGLEKHDLGLEFTLNHIQEATRDMEGYREGTLTLMPLMFNIYAAPPISPHWHILAKGGVSYVMTDRQLSDKDIKFESYPNYRISEEIKDGVGYQFGGGLEYRASKNIRISFEVLQFFFTSTIKHTRKDMNSLRDLIFVDEGEIDLGTILGLMSVRYCW